MVLRPDLKFSRFSGHFKGLKVLKHPAGKKVIEDFKTFFHPQNRATPLDLDIMSSWGRGFESGQGKFFQTIFSSLK